MAQNNNEDNKPELSDVAAREEEILDFWNENKIFEKSVNKEAPNGDYTFYDGPPFATGEPHYGHILASYEKDTIPRYHTMQGKKVTRRWGWDCHGLPLENIIEKELGLKTKQDIEEYGIGKFNQAASDTVMRYGDSWKKVISRIGRWVDMEDDYKTMDWTYTESTWWVFKTLWEKGLIYEGYKSMHVCPRCETTLSNFEVNQGYEDVKDLSVVAKFEVVGEENTHFLAWTTTPWTLPGNIALAVNPEEVYVKVKHEDSTYILAKECIEYAFPDGADIAEEMAGQDLVGMRYTPIFDYYVDADLKGKENAWQVYPADFVTMDDGVGLVHIAGAFGSDDLALAQKYDIPPIHHIHMNGHFKDEVTDFPGLAVKPKDDKEAGIDHMDTDIQVIKYLAGVGKLFKKEKITHSYPHCWRCDTPLLNYATSSWFIKVTDLKDDLIEVNNGINWVPGDVKHGRFGKWLEGARDWAISRSRYWGAPLPVWRNDDTGETFVAGSIEDVRDKVPDRFTKIIFVRHGESEKNLLHIWNDSIEGYPLTDEGEGQADKAGELIANENDVVHAVYSSPVERAHETAEHIAKKLDCKAIETDSRLTEIDGGTWDGHSFEDLDDDIRDEVQAFWSMTAEEAYEVRRGTTGESRKDVDDRTKAFLDEIMVKHAGETVVVVSHLSPTAAMIAHTQAMSKDEMLKLYKKARFLSYAHPFDVYVDSETGRAFDFHRPFIDDVVLPGENDTKLHRIPEVFDCWYESGSMPYGQHHYPFESFYDFDPEKGIGFPADFIYEGTDQTRGWFYSMLVLSVGLFGVSAYKNVVMHGIVQAEDGKKMSKRLKNYPDPMDIVNKYGSDATRFYLLSSPVVRGEDLNFSEKGVAETMRKMVLRLNNVVSFYRMFTEPSDVGKVSAEDCGHHVLDVWMLERLKESHAGVTKGMEEYELDRAARPLMGLIDDLSTWYVRRSRDRFKTEDPKELEVVQRAMTYILRETAKVIAPFMPFTAEDLWQQLRQADDQESVHLEQWAVYPALEQSVLDEMTAAREIVTLGLEARDTAGIKVRQPLGALAFGGTDISESLYSIIADEVNIKKVAYDKDIEGVDLDTNITPELAAEGQARDLIRLVQSLRKDAGLVPDDRIAIEVSGAEVDFIKTHKADILSITGSDKIEYVDHVNDGTSLSGTELQVAIRR